MILRLLGIDQSIVNVPYYIKGSLDRLRYFGYKIDPSCRFELYKNKFERLYIRTIINEQYSVNESVQEELLFGYKDYWELLRISESKAILTSTDKIIRDEINNIFSGGILEGYKNPILSSNTKGRNIQLQLRD